jgi:hypothetical protein
VSVRVTTLTVQPWLPSAVITAPVAAGNNLAAVPRLIPILITTPSCP